ncbi:uncharacterized protein LOC133530807 [Cydia pomonella]|uniref:uncharacterized protein LOC133530807 n=1 Tax=Cydia pomonella TaxID=82600 RepID=UPI002ADD5729|nr:uncharacterized protein LOC133530807 [Cydia pomonella]
MDDAMLVRLELIHERLSNLMAQSTAMGTVTEEKLAKQIQLIEECDSKLTQEIYFYIEKCSQVSSERLKTFTKTQFQSEEWRVEMKALLKNPSVTLTTAKLPKLALPKFKGETLRWAEFWDRFKSNVHDKSLPDAEKMAYLVGCLDAEALQAVEGLGITELNYNVTLEILKERFGNQQKVIDAHYDAINNVQRATHHATDCRANLNMIERHLRVLQSLGETINGNHLRSTILSKFPEKVVYELHLLTLTDNIDNIRSGLQKIITAMESAKESPVPSSSDNISTAALHITTHQKKGKQENKRISHKRGFLKRKLLENTEKMSKNKKPKMACIFCQGAHYNASCTVVQDINDRKKKLGKRCYICFKEGHRTTTCHNRKPCFFCKGSHNQALCPQKPGHNNIELSMASMSLSKHNDINIKHNYCSYLQTAIVEVGPKNSNRTKTRRLILDNGSGRSYITRKLAKELDLVADQEDELMVFVFGADDPVNISSPSVDIQIITRRGIRRVIRVNIVRRITNYLGPPMSMDGIDGVDVVADDGSASEEPQLLMGGDYYYSFHRKEMLLLKDHLYLINTDFGWMIAGKVLQEEKNNTLSVIMYCQCQESVIPYFVTPDLPLREPDIRFLWALESIGIVDSPKITREEEAIKHFNETVKYEDKRYQVKWPWITYPPDLPTNYGLAYGRLSSLIKRLEHDAMEEYDSILREQLTVGVIEVIDPSEIDSKTHPVHYLAHHIILPKGKKGRVVYDGSAKLKNSKSLNECMYRGPSMLEDLTALLLRFRVNKIGITADVEKAFLQVGLQQEDRDVTRFLWLKDPKQGVTEKNLLHLRFCRVPFGVISSPFLLTATIRHHLSKGDQHLMSEIAERTYVDNLVTGTDTLEEARELVNKTRATFTELSMNIREWTSNNKRLLKTIPKQFRSKDTESTKVLGLTWHIGKDTLKLRLGDVLSDTKQDNTTTTKRGILRTLASLYDPCGFAAPLILPAKLLLQELWKRKEKWDSQLPEDLEEEWQKAVSALQTAAEIEIPRHVGLSPNEDTECELHCFTDASKRAYSAVVYLRIVNKKEVSTKVMLIMAKSRVTPINHSEDLKIPKLELLGFVIGKRLLTYVKNTLRIELKRLCLWSDSEIVLYWMKSDKLLPPFVCRRINEIKQNKDIEPRYVNTELNPADLATRPELWHTKKELWFNGPQFLSLSEEGWPKLQEHGQSALFAGTDSIIDTTSSQAEESVRGTIEQEITEGMTIDIENIEDNGQMQVSATGADINCAEIKNLQKLHFPQEAAGKKTSLFRNLGLFVDMDGLLRCKGRLMNTMCSYDTKYPILIPKNSEFTDRLILETHQRYYHVGAPHTLSIIRQKYWIPQGRAKVQRIIRKCQQCIKHGGGPYKLPSTPALPAERANYSAPFTYTGMDYFGPILVMENGQMIKRWICLYTCLAVRAIHMEVVKDLTAEECLLAMRRFISTRGRPELIVSDNALQFKLTAELLANTYFMDNKIRWKFIPQLSPWHGGFYERLVGIVKNCMKRTLAKRVLNDSQLSTVIKEIEAVTNSRPLTCVGSDIEYLLRPTDFLTYGKCIAIEPSIQNSYPGGSVTKENLVEGWKKGRIMLEEFKRMFLGQYLCSLRERYQHSHKEPRVKTNRSPHIGDIVQIKGDSKNRENWKVGKIISLKRGADGECRVAKVNVEGKEFIRSIGHLYPLEVEEARLEDSGTEERIQVNPDVLEAEESSLQGSTEISEIESRYPERESTEQMPLETAVEDDVRLETNGLDKILTPEELIQENGIGEQGKVVSEGDEDVERVETVSDVNEGRSRRAAAVRAREKIAQWTSQLITLL